LYAAGQFRAFSDLNQAVTIREWISTEGNRFGCKSDVFELGAHYECAFADSLEGFIADDALEGGAFDERQIFNGFEFIGESDTREGVAFLECCIS